MEDTASLGREPWSLFDYNEEDMVAEVRSLLEGLSEDQRREVLGYKEVSEGWDVDKQAEYYSMEMDTRYCMRLSGRIRS